MGIQINVYRTIFRTINQRLPPLKGDTGGCCWHYRQIDVSRTVCTSEKLRCTKGFSLRRSCRRRRLMRCAVGKNADRSRVTANSCYRTPPHPSALRAATFSSRRRLWLLQTVRQISVYRTVACTHTVGRDPVAVPEKIFGLTLILDFFDRCHSLVSLPPPQAAVDSLPTGRAETCFAIVRSRRGDYQSPVALPSNSTNHRYYGTNSQLCSTAWGVTFLLRQESDQRRRLGGGAQIVLW